MLTDPAFLAAATLAVILVGLAKGGFAGLGALATPILALVVAPTKAAAILLPILIVQDAVSLWNFRREWDRWIMAWMLPGAIGGVLIGYWFAAELSAQAVMAALGGITLGFGLYRLTIEHLARRRQEVLAASTSPGWVGTLFGVATGFTSQIAHLGGPPFQMWVTPRRLPHLVYIGTQVLLFAILNWIKVPTFIALGEFDREVLTISAALIPLAIASTMAGVWLVRRISAARFYTLIYVLMVLLGAKLLWDALGAVGA